MGRHKQEANERHRAILDLYYRGEFIPAIAKKFGCSHQNIQQVIKRYGHGPRLTVWTILPYKPTVLPARVRFWKMVDSSGGEAACWPWLGRTHASGYGFFYLHYNRKLKYSHQIAFYFSHGKAAKHHVLHKCGNAICCNPHHLYDGTPKQNAADRTRHARERGIPFGQLVWAGRRQRKKSSLKAQDMV